MTDFMTLRDCTPSLHTGAHSVGVASRDARRWQPASATAADIIVIGGFAANAAIARCSRD